MGFFACLRFQNGPDRGIHWIQVRRIWWLLIKADEVGKMLLTPVLDNSRFMRRSAILLEGPLSISKVLNRPRKQFLLQNVKIVLAVHFNTLGNKDQRCFAVRSDPSENHNRCWMRSAWDASMWIGNSVNTIVLLIQYLLNGENLFISEQNPFVLPCSKLTGQLLTLL